MRFGVLRRTPYQDSPKRHEYILTQKGLDLYPIVMSIVHWGDIHMAGKKGTSPVRRISAEERARAVTRNADMPWNRREHA